MNNLLYGHIIISVVYIFFTLITKSKEKFFRLSIVTLLPYFGFVFFLISDFAFHLRKRSNINEDTLVAKNIIEKDKHISKPNIYHEVCEDETYMALSDINGINDYKTRRKKIFDEINSDIEMTSPYIKEFLKDQDTEISHYSAAIITGTLQKTNKLYKKAKAAHEKDVNNTKIMVKYIKTILQYINLGIFQEDEVLQKRKEFSEVFEKLEKNAKTIEEDIYVEAIENEMQLDQVSRAIDVLDMYCEDYSKSEKTDYMILKILYSMGDYKSFRRHLDFIKNRDNDVSTEFNQILNFWKEAC